MTSLKTGIRPDDLAREAWSSVSNSPGRSLMTTLGTLLGSLAFVATLGITGTISQQVSDSFDIRRATEVTAEMEVDPTTAESSLPAFMEATAISRVTRLNGVSSAGSQTDYFAVAIHRGIMSQDLQSDVPLSAISPGALDVIEPTVESGRAFDSGHYTRSDQVIMLSKSAANQLQISRPGTAVFILDQPFTVIGIYNEVERQFDTLGGALIPQSTTGKFNFGVQHRRVLIETVPGAAQQIGSQVALALQPNNPAGLNVTAPPDPQTLRQEVEGSVTQMSLLASLVALIAGSISIGNSATANMVQRIPEIGLRRALGARRRSIFAQMLSETTFLGMCGGIAGAFLGVTATVIVSLVNGWVPLVEVAVIGLAIGAGTVAGSTAGILPAVRATQISPTEALSR